MYEQVFASIFRPYKTVAFLCVEPLDCTFTHAVFSIVLVKDNENPTPVHLLEIETAIFSYLYS
jgi:hypothetical protein